jgi:hypothetical protein
MKPTRDATDLAARLSTAARAPLALPQPPAPANAEPPAEVVAMASRPEPQGEPTPEAPTTKRVRLKPKADTLAITLRPDRELYDRYVLASAERTRRDRKTISPQQIMLEVLAKALES